MTVVGARPQFIKAAVLSRLIREQCSDRLSEYLVHTGQHCDDNMSEVFFWQLSTPAERPAFYGNGDAGSKILSLLLGG